MSGCRNKIGCAATVFLILLLIVFGPRFYESVRTKQDQELKNLETDTEQNRKQIDSGQETEIDSGQETEMFADFPEGVPIYSGAEIAYIRAHKTAEGDVIAGALKTTDDLAEVVEFYEVELKKNGFDITSREDTGQEITLNAIKGGMSMVVGMNSSGGETNINLTITLK